MRHYEGCTKNLAGAIYVTVLEKRVLDAQKLKRIYKCLKCQLKHLCNF